MVVMKFRSLNFKKVRNISESAQLLRILLGKVLHVIITVAP